MSGNPRSYLLLASSALVLLGGCGLPSDSSSAGLLLGSDVQRGRQEMVRAAFRDTSLANTVVGFVMRDGAEEFVAMGTRSIDDATPVDPNTVFDIASMTKAVTATAALQLVEQGQLNLDEPLEEVLPELRQIQILEEDGSRRAPRRPLTLRDLLRHTSGFAYFFNTPVVAAELEFDPVTRFPKPETLADGEYDWGFDVRPRRVFDAGERWCYGRGVGVAGRVIERVTGVDLDTYFKRHIFKPLGMTRSGYNLPADVMRDRAAMHARDPNTGHLVVMPDVRPVPMEQFYGGGSLLSTPRDYATFLRCLLNGGELEGVRILGEEMVALMTSDQLPAGVRVNMNPLPGAQDGARRSFVSDYNDGYSLAWALEVGAEDGLRPEGVGYWSGIFNTFYTMDPVRGVAIMSFSQLMPFDDAEAYELYRSYEDAVYEALR